MYKDLLARVLKWLDNGQFFITPMKWFYALKGIIIWLLPLWFVYYIVANWEDLSYMFDLFKTWNKVVAIIMLFLYFVILLGLSFLSMQYWFKRMRRLDQIAHEGDSIVAIPLVADNIKNDGEWAGIFGWLGIASLSILVFVYFILTGAADFYRAENIWRLPLIIVVVNVAAILYAWICILLTHFIGELIRISAEICNNLRDVADIHRAATVVAPSETTPEQPNEASEEPAEAAPTSNE